MVFRDALDKISALKQRVYRLGEYSRLKVEEDAGLDANQARSQKMSALRQRFMEATSYLEPKVLSLGQDHIEAFEKTEPGLLQYHRTLKLILRRAPHMLGDEGEKILAAARPLQRQPSDIHDVLFLCRYSLADARDRTEGDTT